MSHDAPTWARALLTLDAAARRALRAETALRDELLCALLDEAQRARLTASIYASHGTYRAGSRLDREGLMPWEREALAHPCFPRAGVVLVAGCGGGRELAALRSAGYRAVGFDPCETLVDEVRARDPELRCVVARIEDLPRAAEGVGPMGFLRDAVPDAVIFGWTSLSYVSERSTRVAALQAVRALCPAAPVLLSTWGPRPEEAPALRRWLRRATAYVGRAAPPGMTFRPWAGFVVPLSAAELADTAGAAGYAVLAAGASPDPWALVRVSER